MLPAKVSVLFPCSVNPPEPCMVPKKTLVLFWFTVSVLLPNAIVAVFLPYSVPMVSLAESLSVPAPMFTAPSLARIFSPVPRFNVPDQIVVPPV